MTMATILASTSTLFTFIFGLIILKQRFLWLSALGVLAAIGGAVLTSVFKPEAPGQTTDQESQVIGIVLAVGGALVFGLVNTLIRKWLKDEEHTDTLFGLIGLASIVMAAPALFLAHVSQVEVFKLPANHDCWWIMSLSALLGTVLSSYLWGVSVAILGPMIVSVSIVSTIPVGAVIDQIRYNLSFSLGYVAGMILVILAVAVVAYDQTRNSKEEEVALNYVSDEKVRV